MNEKLFTGKAALYKKFRPSYPKELIDYLYSEIGFAEESVIADIGAGTGIFTRLLLERGSKIYAVECQRILRPGGKVIIIWNNIDNDSEITRKSGDIIVKYRIHDKSGQQWSGNLYDYSDFYANGVYEYKTFRNDFYESRENFLGGNLSASYAPREDSEPEQYHGFVKELNELFDEYNEHGILHIPQITRSYAGSME